ncbi:hypothetical protein JOQ06_022273 [Pogonophryne albipinna]|uniref:Uncharacterized protein n=1 Tax=Pogonophryne albipinna TaxID=1090488 RepID=A0AAD6F5A1_9TELE|nr:hypothetical protein JOQ06_022273 [Pogonophryne albipinna]
MSVEGLGTVEAPRPLLSRSLPSGKNPVSVLMEYGQRSKSPIEFIITGPPAHPTTQSKGHQQEKHHSCAMSSPYPELALPAMAEQKEQILQYLLTVGRRNRDNLHMYGSDYSPSHYCPSHYRPADYSPSDYSPSDDRGSHYSRSDYSPSNYSPSNYSPSEDRASDFYRYRPAGYSSSSDRGTHYSPSHYSPSNVRGSDFSPSHYHPAGYSPSHYSPDDYRPDDRGSDFSPSHYHPAGYSSSSSDRGTHYSPSDDRGSDFSPSHYSPAGYSSSDDRGTHYSPSHYSPSDYSPSPSSVRRNYRNYSPPMTAAPTTAAPHDSGTHYSCPHDSGTHYSHPDDSGTHDSRPHDSHPHDSRLDDSAPHDSPSLIPEEHDRQTCLRGCGRLVSSNGNTGRHDGRLDVCFTPQDYFIWKSRDSLLRLSNSGRQIVNEESALPKTYSTRRGQLQLYSQDLVTIETSAVTRDGKQKVVQRYTRQDKSQLSTLKELTAAILSYSNTQYTSSRLGPLFLPPLHHRPLAPDLHHPIPPPLCTTQVQPSPELLGQFNPECLPAEGITEFLGNQPEGLLPPLTVGQSASHRPCLENTARPKWEGARTDEHHTAHCLPPIAESRTVKILHQQPRFLPLLFPEREDPPPPVAGSIAGRKGPGKQSSLAFLQNRQLDLQNPCTSRDPSRGVVRGILPLELRDLQNGKPVGCLILGPDGEIIQLSLYNDNHDHDTQEQGGELEPNTDVPDGDIQHHQAIHKLVEFHTLTEINACSPSSQKDPEAVTETKTKTSEAVAWTKVIKNHITIPPLKEQVGKEEPRAGNTEQGSIHGSHQPGKREMKPGKSEASDGQKTSRARTEGGWERQKTKSDAESIRRRTEEERTNREEADTQHHSALPSVVKINEEPMKKEEEINQNIKKASDLKSTERPSATQRHNNKTHLEEEKEHVNINADKHSQSESSLRSAASPFSPKSLKRSSASFCEGVEHASATGLAPSRGCLSSCSTVMITEEELMLNPIKQESSRPRNGLEEEEVAAVRLAKRAERRRQDVERKRREREEEELKQQKREETEERMKNELERLRLEEERQQEEERKKLLEMEESERIEYLFRKEQEEESRRNEDEHRKRREEEATLQAAVEARLQAEQLAREMALLQQQLAVQRRLLLEAGGLEKTQGISRPWIYSYFTLLQLLGVNPTTAETITPD